MPIFTTRRSSSVAALGESRLIAAVQNWLGDTSPKTPFGIGDDCAVLPPSRRPQLVTTDPVIFGRHFDDSVPARDAGAKLLKRNISDIAAMGGRPVAAVISLALAPETNVAWLRGFYLGLATTARRYGVKIVGGDITEAPRGFFGAFLTLHGEAAGPRILTRTGAKRGDHIFVTGNLGGSRSGRHYSFTPRLEEGMWLAKRKDVRSMMDVSDGIAKDIWSLTPKGAVPSIWPPVIPVNRAARLAARKSGQAPWVHALTDGEDYELLFAVDAKTDPVVFTLQWFEQFETPLQPIGTFAGKISPGHVDWKALRGYEHLH